MPHVAIVAAAVALGVGYSHLGCQYFGAESTFTAFGFALGAALMTAPSWRRG